MSYSRFRLMKSPRHPPRIFHKSDAVNNSGVNLLGSVGFDTNLTYSGYGRLNLRRVFDVLAGVTGG